jgi:hypothetical protein
MMSLMMEVMMFLLMILLKVGYQPSLIRIEKKPPRAVLNIVGFREPASLLHCISYSQTQPFLIFSMFYKQSSFGFLHTRILC